MNCPKCNSTNYFPVYDTDGETYLNHWCEDCVFSMIACALNPEKHYFSDDEIAQAFVNTLMKIDGRAQMIRKLNSRL